MKYKVNKTLSVIIPFYNELDLIARAVDSVFEQRKHDVSIDVIVVNDGTLSEKYILDVIGRDNVRVEMNKYCKGPGGARNTGLDLAIGDVIAFLDADDYWSPDKVHAQLKKFSTDVNFVCTGYKFEGGNTVIVPPSSIEKALDIFLKQGVGTSTVMITSDLLGDTRFNDYRFSQDIDFWYRLATKEMFSYARVSEPLVTYYTKGSTKNKFVQLKHFINILNKNEMSMFNKSYILLKYIIRGLYNYYIRR